MPAVVVEVVVLVVLGMVLFCISFDFAFFVLS